MIENPYAQLVMDITQEMRRCQLEGNIQRLEILFHVKDNAMKRYQVWEITNRISEKMGAGNGLD